MPRRIAVSTLNASTIDIINTIRDNASLEYQQSVPEVTKTEDIPKVGEVLYGYPALANQFINALVNRIALVRINSATFNNAYAQLKKGYLEFGETVEEVFISITKVREFSAEKAGKRELARSLPEVKTAFHTMNWRVQYPVTIQDEDLRMAFLSATGVQDLIAKIINSVMTAVEYDEYLLFKYLIIKAVSHGKMYPVAIGNTGDMKEAAVQFRGVSNDLTFMKTKYNEMGVHTVTPKADQYIIMDSFFNAKYDVNVLASAFNMDKADFMGRLMLIDDFTTFDNERFATIRENSTMIEEVTKSELALMRDVKAILVDKEFFQVYDNQNRMTDTYVASGEYWNYFYNVWKTVSSSPFSNAVVFIASDTADYTPATFTVKVTDKTVADNATTLTLGVQSTKPSLNSTCVEFVQDKTATTAGIAIHKYGAVLFPANAGAITLNAKIGNVAYKATTTISPASEVGASFVFNKV